MLLSFCFMSGDSYMLYTEHTIKHDFSCTRMTAYNLVCATIIIQRVYI